MTTPDPNLPIPTHTVLNQPTHLQDYDLYASDRILQTHVAAQGAGWDADALSAFGRLVGTAEMLETGHLANHHRPELHAFDRFGHRIDEVHFHPSYHKLMATSLGEGLHALPWTQDRPGTMVARVARCYLMSQVEQGHGCPVTMTFAVTPVLRLQPEVADTWLPKVLTRGYDPRHVPASEKAAVTIGMAMTEKQGGSDVRSNTTRAWPVGEATGPGRAYRLVGHKWFCSAPMCDAFLALAWTDRGLSCFFVPRWSPDGERNNIHIRRLKDKLGNRSNASGEVEYAGSWALMVGEEGRGVRTIIEMVQHTRLDCVMGSASVMRAAVVQAIWHTGGREAFGKRLIDQPLMRNVLADLALEAEAAVALSLRLGRAFQEGRTRPEAAALARIATAAAKYHVCKRAPQVAYEAMECHGGNGYVEEGPIARLFREGPLNAIWEGSGNVVCLDVLRAMAKEPDTVEALLAELDVARGRDVRYDRFVATLRDELAHPKEIELRARHLVESMALAMQANLLLQHAPQAVAEAFVVSRLARFGYQLGTLPPGIDIDAILERARPAL